jgi:predicted lipoprotein with Yx(FWY)xxD motif
VSRVRCIKGAALLVAMMLAGCGGAEDRSEAPVSAAASPGAKEDEKGKRAGPAKGQRKRSGTKVETGRSWLGRVLVDADRQALYYFDFGDEPEGRPECYEECARAWPPLPARGRPRAGDGVKGGELGTVEREDGIRQVTYTGRPLYRYADERPRYVDAHAMPAFGGLWLAVQPSGRPVP